MTCLSTFTDAGGENWQIAHVLDSGTRFSILQSGNLLDGRTITLIADDPPEVALTAEPSETLRTGLRLDVAASDDYGLESITGEIRRPDGAGDDVLRVFRATGATGNPYRAGSHLLQPDGASMGRSRGGTGSGCHGRDWSEEYERPSYLRVAGALFSITRWHAKSRSSARRSRWTGTLQARRLRCCIVLSREPESYLSEVDVHLALVTGALRPRLQRRSGIDSRRCDRIDVGNSACHRRGPAGFR